jgi:pyrimidine operon attenuation protein/uracil phosphoribosyltransferase
MEQQILDKAGIEKAISRLSDEILKKNADPSTLIIVGIKKRGDVLAKKIAQRIESTEKKKIEISAIDITFYRDDVQLKAYKYVLKNDIHFDVSDKNVVLVDDVISTGRTIRAAIDIIIDSGRPRSIQLAVLIDKGGRELPIQPDYIGKKIDADASSEILVKLKEVDGEDRIIITDNEK